MKGFHAARYMLFMMGFFAIYNGLLYNECFAIPLDLFGTNWKFTGIGNDAVRLDNGYTYPFGVDPAWGVAQNQLVYYNSLKMKLSIVFGVAQMVFGIILSATNAVYFKRTIDLVCTFVPQMIFMCFVFGYLWTCIIAKWLIDFSTHSNDAPGLIALFLGFFMSSGNVAKNVRLYGGQESLQPFLLIMAFLMVPIMLGAKPFFLKRAYKHKLAEGHIPIDPHTNQPREFPMGEVIIHNSIHTIEFLLGSVSNTASYLRLWALSLAHSELSKVFFDKILEPTMEMHLSGVITFFGFSFFAAATFGVIILMESLSALLHALRLHWVEFQNKFYTGAGRKFVPFSLKAVVAEI